MGDNLFVAVTEAFTPIADSEPRQQMPFCIHFVEACGFLLFFVMKNEIRDENVHSVVYHSNGIKKYIYLFSC
jgi:hypothetical protein